MTAQELETALEPILSSLEVQTQVLSGLFLFLGIIFGIIFIGLFFRRFQ